MCAKDEQRKTERKSKTVQKKKAPVTSRPRHPRAKPGTNEPDCAGIAKDLRFVVTVLKEAAATTYKPSAKRLLEVKQEFLRKYPRTWLEKRQAHFDYTKGAYPTSNPHSCWHVAVAYRNFQGKTWPGLKRFVELGVGGVVRKYGKTQAEELWESLKRLVRRPIALCGREVDPILAKKVEAPPSEPSTPSPDPDGVLTKRFNKRIARRILLDAAGLIRAGRKMESLRRTRDLGKLRRCGELMRKYQPQARKLRKDVSYFPIATRLVLAQAVGDLWGCVSCATDGRSYCKRASKGLRYALRTLKIR